MSRKKTSGISSKAVILAGVAFALSLPTAALAVGLLDQAELSPADSFTSFTPAAADPRLAKMIEARTGGKARLVRFTPAGFSSDADRSVTVAVRVDEEAAQAISVHSAIRTTRDTLASAEAASPRIAPTRYNLGLARGYSSFAQAPAISTELSSATIPDLAQFEPNRGVREEESRFAARIALEEQSQPAARSSRQSLESIGDQSLDVAGSYRLTRNLDVTAGVRFQQDRDRLTSLPNLEQQDSQAVYIGTQFRF